SSSMTFSDVIGSSSEPPSSVGTHMPKMRFSCSASTTSSASRPFSSPHLACSLSSGAMPRARSSSSGVVVVSVIPSPPSGVAPDCANYPRRALPTRWVASLHWAQRPHVGRRLRLLPGQLGHRVLECLDAVGQALDRVGDRVGQVNPVRVGALDLAPVDAHHMP